MASTPPTVPTSAPTNKAIAATGASAFGAAISTLVLYLLDRSNTLPPQVSGAITTLVTAAVTLAAAYFTPPGVSETVVMDDAGKMRTARAAVIASPPPSPSTN